MNKQPSSEKSQIVSQLGKAIFKNDLTTVLNVLEKNPDLDLNDPKHFDIPIDIIPEQMGPIADYKFDSHPLLSPNSINDAFSVNKKHFLKQPQISCTFLELALIPILNKTPTTQKETQLKVLAALVNSGAKATKTAATATFEVLEKFLMTPPISDPRTSLSEKSKTTGFSKEMALLNSDSKIFSNFIKILDSANIRWQDYPNSRLGSTKIDEGTLGARLTSVAMDVFKYQSDATLASQPDAFFKASGMPLKVMLGSKEYIKSSFDEAEKKVISLISDLSAGEEMVEYFKNKMTPKVIDSNNHPLSDFPDPLDLLMANREREKKAELRKEKFFENRVKIK